MEDRFAGKRVKCRNCESIISVPAGGEDGLEDLAALGEAQMPTAWSEDSDSAPAAEGSAGASFPHEDVDAPAIPSLPAGFGAALRAARSRIGIRRFRVQAYPGAYAMDVGLPWIVGLVCLIPTIWYGIQTAMSADPQWVTFTYYGLIFLLFLVLMIPVTARGLRMAGEMLHFELPSSALWRTLGIFSLPLALAAMFYWQLNEFSGLFFGLALGLLVVGPLILIVMHLHWVEAAVAWMMGALFFGASAAVTAGVAFIVGLIIVASTATPAKPPAKTIAKTPTKTPIAVATTEPAVTPTDVPPVTPDPLAVKPATPDTPTTNSTVATAPPDEFMGFKPVKPPPPPPVVKPPEPVVPKIEVVKVEQSPIVASIKDMDWLPPIDSVVQTQVGTTPLAVLVRTADAERLQIINAPHDHVAGEVSFKKDPVASDRYVINPAGDTVLRTVSWPRLAVQVLSTAPGRMGRIIDLDETFGSAKLLGVTSTDQLFVQRERGGQYGLEIWNVRTGVRARPISLPPVVENGLAISPDGKYMAVAMKFDGQAQVQLINAAGGVKKLPIKKIDAKWPLEPVALTFSPDSTRLAICFEHDGGLLAVAWSTAGASVLYEQVYLPGTLTIPAPGVFKGRALDWIGEDSASWLLYGRAVIDPLSGNQLGALGVPNVISQTVIDPKAVDLLTTLPAGGNRVVHVELNADLLNKMRVAATQPAK